MDRKSVGEMVGECLRDAGLLTSVFLPLDNIFTDKPLTAGWFVTILILGGGFIIMGIVIERRRR